MTVNYRPGQQTDAAACVDLLRDWAAETPWMAKLDTRDGMLAYWRKIFASDQTWVAETAGCIVGFCTRDTDNIGALYVARNARGAGIGKHLLDLAKADRDWITVWAYEKNDQALRFYAREGLVEISREVEESSNLMNIEHRWEQVG